MKQACLCKYLGVHCNHPDTLLRIPASIRRRIYIYAGLPVGTFLSYPVVGPVEGDNNPQITYQTYDIIGALSEVCRQVRYEVDAIILNENTLVYNSDEVIDPGLEFLEVLSQYEYSLLRNIYIDLTVGFPYSSSLAPDLPTWKLIELWQSAATKILAHATPQQLKLHVICNTNNKKKAAAVLQPLREFPGVLLEVELGFREEFRAQVRETALQVQAPIYNPPGSFSFLDLPGEIRRLIYGYTNLVTPFRKVHWNPDMGFYGSSIFCECDGTVCREEDLHANRRFWFCGAYSRMTGDFCTRYTGSYSRNCVHGLSPLSLFLTCRAIYNEAIAFFFANNRVVIIPDFSADRALFAQPALNPPPSQLNATEGPNGESQIDTPMVDAFDGELGSEDEPFDIHMTHDVTKLFMEKVGPTALRLIRNLEILFPAFHQHTRLSKACPAYREWCMAVSQLTQLAESEPLPNLTLSIHMWTTPLRTYPSMDHIRQALKIDAPQIIKPLRPLTQLGLNRLFVHLEWSRHWSSPKLLHDIENSKLPKTDSPGCGIGHHWIPQPMEELMEMEARLEKMVMGDEYDSFALGKGEELPSAWMRGLWDQG